MMTFFSLLTKELRLRMRRERTIWIIIAYILLMGLLGWVSVNSYSRATIYNNSALSSVGLMLYYLLSQLQLFLIIFITPAFTATAVNSEKERQTFDLLLCSRLSAFSLLAGKLLAGLMNALLLIAAAAPLFSLVFFFGGVGPSQIAKAVVVYVMTTVLVGTFSLFCSTAFQRPAVSTAISYMVCLVWIGLPLVIAILAISSPAVSHPPMGGPVPQPTLSHQLPPWLAINPVTALTNTYPNGGMLYYGFYNPFLSLTAAFYPTNMYGAPGSGLGTYFLTVLGFKLVAWRAYTLLSLLGSVIFFLLSIWMVRPNMLGRLRAPAKREKVTEEESSKAPVTA